jgi:hypothetical protein
MPCAAFSVSKAFAASSALSFIKGESVSAFSRLPFFREVPGALRLALSVSAAAHRHFVQGDRADDFAAGRASHRGHRVETAVVVTQSSFLVSEGLVCDPRPNDIRRCLRCYELLGGKEWPPQVRSRRKPAQQPAPNWGNLSGSPLRNSRRSSRQECVEALSRHAVGRRYREYPEAGPIRFSEPQ